MNLPLRYIVYAVILVLFQGIVCKHIFLGSGTDVWLDVIIYPLLIIILPVNTNPSIVVVIGFFMGLGVDFFYNSPGVHTAALVFMAFIRKTILDRLAPRTGYATDDTPLRISPSDYWYYIFSAILLSIYLILYYFILYFSFSFILPILIKTILSFFISMLFIGIHATLWRSINL